MRGFTYKAKPSNRKMRYEKYGKGSVGEQQGYWGSDFKLQKPIKHRPKNPKSYL
jgi:hypothetical protein